MELIGFILLLVVPVGIFWMWFQEMFAKPFRILMTWLYLFVFVGVLFLGYKADNTPPPPVEPTEEKEEEIFVNNEEPQEKEAEKAKTKEKAPEKAVEKELEQREDWQAGKQVDFDTSVNVVKLLAIYDQFQKNPQEYATEETMMELDVLLREVEASIEELQDSTFFAEELEKGDAMKVKFDFYHDTFNLVNTIHEAIMTGDQAKMDEAKVLSQEAVNSQIAYMEMAKKVKEQTDALKSQQS